MALGSSRTLSSRFGFSKLLGKDANQFILLDKDTNGSVGRAIYIDAKLSDNFAGLESSQSDFILHRLKTLRATAGGANAYSNIHDAMEHKTAIGTAVVHYKIFQSTGSDTHRPGVYITHIIATSYKEQSPGLYRASLGQEGWQVEKDQTTTITTDFAAINGACRDLTQAATRVLPELLAKAYSDKKWQGDLNSGGYTLFYNPPCLYDSFGIWKTPRQKSFSRAYAGRALTDALLDASKRKQPVQWLVHGDGAHVLRSALRQVQGADLNNHTFLFAAPTSDVSALLPSIRQSKIQLHDDVMKIQDADWRSKQAQMWHARRLERELQQIPGFADQAATLREQGQRDLMGFCGSLVGAASAGAALVALSPALPTPGAVAAAAAGAYATWDKARTLRNIAANNLNVPGLNPHMHPFDNNDQMNRRAVKHSGSPLKTFADVLKAKFRR